MIRKNVFKVLIAILITFILSLMAFSNGWGYQIVEFNIDYASSFEFPPHQLALPTHIEITLNPFLFPINYVYNAEVISSDFVFVISTAPRSGFFYVPGPSMYGSITPSERAEAIAGTLVFSELGKNVPFYFFTGLLIVYSTDKLVKRLLPEKKTLNNFPEMELEIKV